MADAKAEGSSRFAKWIDDTGPQKIADALKVGLRVVYAWRAKSLGKTGGYRPDPSRLGEILKLAGGKLVAADIYPPRPAKARRS